MLRAKLLALLASAPLLLAAEKAFALCYFGSGENFSITHNVGTVFIPRDAPVGSIIGGLAVARATGGYFGCQAGSSFEATALAPVLPDVVVGGWPSLPAGKIISTNIPGVGVVFSCGGPLCGLFGVDGTGYWPASNPSLPGNPRSNGSAVRGTLIKTGPIDGSAGPVALSGTMLQVTSDGGYVVFTLSLTGTVTVSGCSIPAAPGNNIPVPMGNIPQRAFQGPGTSAPAVDFNITLNSCVAGTYNPVPGGFIQGNFANIQLDAIRGSTVIDAARGMLGVSPSANPDDDATGVAVQVLQADGSTPMELGVPVQLNRINNGTTLVPLKARYVQTGDGHAPTPGTANAYASFTVTYR
jgi:type 1 fimbria pilin